MKCIIYRTADEKSDEHQYREVTGSNPVEVLNFSGLHTQLQKLCSIARIIAHLNVHTIHMYAEQLEGLLIKVTKPDITIPRSYCILPQQN